MYIYMYCCLFYIVSVHLHIYMYLFLGGGGSVGLTGLTLSRQVSDEVALTRIKEEDWEVIEAGALKRGIGQNPFCKRGLYSFFLGSL